LIRLNKRSLRNILFIFHELLNFSSQNSWPVHVAAGNRFWHCKWMMMIGVFEVGRLFCRRCPLGRRVVFQIRRVVASVSGRRPRLLLAHPVKTRSRSMWPGTGFGIANGWDDDDIVLEED